METKQEHVNKVSSHQSEISIVFSCKCYHNYKISIEDYLVPVERNEGRYVRTCKRCFEVGPGWDRQIREYIDWPITDINHFGCSMGMSESISKFPEVALKEKQCSFQAVKDVVDEWFGAGGTHARTEQPANVVGFLQKVLGLFISKVNEVGNKTMQLSLAESTNLKRSDKEQEVKENKPEAEDIDEDESAISVRDLRAKKTLLLETHNINETIKQRLREYNLCLERPVTEPALPAENPPTEIKSNAVRPLHMMEIANRHTDHKTVGILPMWSVEKKTTMEDSRAKRGRPPHLEWPPKCTIWKYALAGYSLPFRFFLGIFIIYASAILFVPLAAGCRWRRGCDALPKTPQGGTIIVTFIISAVEKSAIRLPNKSIEECRFGIVLTGCSCKLTEFCAPAQEYNMVIPY
ncbi:hypothetical protein GEV33_005741 [Tenebrio molitor]|uniref:Uncharacterized protein n=1 Tax=Tenebrio molitor TaxID=7067 RepID=A0A8J6HLY3_TENMO|nr:hypothetical protein GEV33_005741 [Tenebrio molitor]